MPHAVVSPQMARGRRPRRLAMQAAREIATTISQSSNKVYLGSDSLLLSVVRRVLGGAEGGWQRWRFWAGTRGFW